MPAYLKARPSTKSAPKVKKRDIPPTLPIGSPYLPSVNVPEPATLVGDNTGKEYIRMGDNPNGPEQLQVTPPGGGGARMPVGKGGPVSMALGGTATVGGNKYNPTKAALDMNRWRKGQMQGIFSARKNVADLEAVAKANTIRDSENYKYGAAGVAAPARINLPRGVSSAGLNPSVAANYQTEAQRLEQEYGEENTIRSLDMEAEGLQNTLNNQAPGGAGARRAAGYPATTGRAPEGYHAPGTVINSADGYGGNPLKDRPPPPGMVWYQPPNGGAKRLVKETEAAILMMRDKELLGEEDILRAHFAGVAQYATPESVIAALIALGYPPEAAQIIYETALYAAAPSGGNVAE